MPNFKDIGKGLIHARQIASLADSINRRANPDTSEFSINKFTSKINDLGGLTQNNRFLVTVSFPSETKVPKAAREFGVQGRAFQFLCSSSSLPGFSFTTTEVRRHGYGPMTFYPSNIIYPELPLNFFIDNKGKMLEFLHSWFNTVVFTGNTPGVDRENTDGAKPFEMYYKKEYEAKIIITLLNQHNDSVIEYEIEGVVPASLADTTLEWGSSDLMQVSTTFRFDTYKVTSIHRDYPAQTSRGLSILETISKSAALGAAIYSTVRTPQSIGDAVNLANNALLIKDNFHFSSRGGT